MDGPYVVGEERFYARECTEKEKAVINESVKRILKKGQKPKCCDTYKLVEEWLSDKRSKIWCWDESKENRWWKHLLGAAMDAVPKDDSMYKLHIKSGDSYVPGGNIAINISLHDGDDEMLDDTIFHEVVHHLGYEHGPEMVKVLKDCGYSGHGAD